MSHLDAAAAEFMLGLDEILLHVRFVEASLTLRPRLGGALNWRVMSAEEKSICDAFMQAKADGFLILQGLQIRLMASLEAAVRRMIEDSVVFLNSKRLSFELIGRSLTLKNRVLVGRSLLSLADPAPRHTFNFDTLCDEIGTCVPGRSQVKLSAEAFRIGAKGAGAKLIESAFDLFGVDLNWDSLADDADVKSFLKIVGTREAAKEVVGIFNTLQRQRNNYAHTGVPGETISIEELRSSCEFAKALIPAFKNLLESHVRSLVKPK